MQVIRVVNISYTSYNVAIILVYFEHLLSSLFSALDKEVNLERNLVSFLDVLLYFFNTTWQDFVTILVYALSPARWLIAQANPRVPVVFYPQLIRKRFSFEQALFAEENWSNASTFHLPYLYLRIGSLVVLERN